MTRCTKPSWLLIGLILSLPTPAPAQELHSPIIDMHVHTHPWSAPKEEQQSTDWKQGWEETQLLMNRSNIVLGLVSGPIEGIQAWSQLAQSRLIAGIMFPCDGGVVPNSNGRKCLKNGESYPNLDWLRQEIESGRIGFLGELVSQYAGLPPNDPALEPYYDLAEELDIPVAIHIGLGPPGAVYNDGWCGKNPCAPQYKANLSRPLLLEDVLIRHPHLRIYVMHAGWPMLEEMLNLLHSHPQVYVDIAVLTFENVTPRKAFHRYLQTLVDYGYGKRIFWGSDFTMNFEEAIEAVESADFLTQEQKADIFYNNAARFLRLTEEEISAHHKR